MIKAIIFDCFGVLAGSAYREIYRQAGGDIEKDYEYVSSLLQAANTGQISSKELHQKTAEKLGMSLDGWTKKVNDSEQPNVELLDYIKQLKKKYKIAVLSNAGVGVLERKFSAEQLKLFDAKVVSAEVGLYKPQAEIFELTADRLNVQVDECVFVDDLAPYVTAAQSVGMRAILYENFVQMKKDLERILSAS